MVEITMKGLVGSSPLTVLASYGLLNICEEIKEFRGAKLAWRMRTENGTRYDEPIASLHIVADFESDEFINKVTEKIKKRVPRLVNDYFGFADDVRIEPVKFREILTSRLLESSNENRELVDILGSLGSESVTDGTKNLVKPTLFHMTAGQQLFLRELRKTITSMSKRTHEALKEALFGPWQYNDPFHSLGWDPNTERLHALRVKAPSSEPPISVRAATYLASEAIPLFPTFVLPNMKIWTRGFVQSYNRRNFFLWPLWNMPIGLDSLKSLLGMRYLYEPLKYREDLKRKNIFAIYQSERYEFGQGYGIFRPSSVVWTV